MAKEPTQKPPAGMPCKFDQTSTLNELMALRGDMVNMLTHVRRTEVKVSLLSAQMADAEKRLDTRIVERVAPLMLRVVSTTEKAMVALGNLPAEIERAGLESRQQIARSSLLAKRLMQGVETEAFIRMQTMRDQAVTVVKEVQDESRTKMRDMRDHAIAGMDKARDEAITVLQGMGNSAKNLVAQAGGSIAGRLEEAANLGKRLVEESATTARNSIMSTAATASAEFIKTTAEAKKVAQTSAATIATFEASVAQLNRVGKWLGEALERRTWQIARATWIQIALTLCLAATLYQVLLLVLGPHY